jgi:hypothetical protein
MGKGSKRKDNLTGAQKQEMRAKRLEARRAAKAEAEARRRKQERRERIVRLVIMGFVVVSLVWFIFLRNQQPKEIDGHPITQFSTAGVNNHTSDPVNYETLPAVSGEHAPGAAPCGVYDQQIPDETQVHMLEHGAVGIQYLPTLPVDQIKEIEAIVEDSERDVFSAPYPGMESQVAVSSWSRKMELDELDASAVEQYIDAFAGKGPESGQECPKEVDSPFEPQASPSPTPVATISPEPEDAGGSGKGKKGKDSDG